jgi:small-conductance mechanosensitive channel
VTENTDAWGFLRKLSWEDMLFVVGVLVLAWIVAAVIRWSMRHLAEKGQPKLRLFILRFVPISRLLVAIACVVIIVPILIEPKFQNVIALIASVGVAFAFAFKDYASCLAGGLITVLENTYQPGDWIEVDGIYGEVKSIDMRAVRIVTPDDTEVFIPHLRLWSTSIFNASSGNQSLLCVANFYLHPEHDASLVRSRLTEVAENSLYRKSETPLLLLSYSRNHGEHTTGLRLM